MEVANENETFDSDKENKATFLCKGIARYDDVSPASSISSALPPLATYSPNRHAAAGGKKP